LVNDKTASHIHRKAMLESVLKEKRGFLGNLYGCFVSCLSNIA